MFKNVMRKPALLGQVVFFSSLLVGCDNNLYFNVESQELFISDGFSQWQDPLVWLDENINGQLDDNEQVITKVMSIQSGKEEVSTYLLPENYHGVIAAKNIHLEGALPVPTVMSSLPEEQLLISPLSSLVIKLHQICGEEELTQIKTLIANEFSDGDLNVYQDLESLEGFKGRVLSVLSGELLNDTETFLNEMEQNTCQSIPSILSEALTHLSAGNSDILVVEQGQYFPIEAIDSDQDDALNYFDVAPYNASLKADVDGDNIADELEESLGLDTSIDDRYSLFEKIELTTDSDSDGLPDLYELAFGWLPTDPNSPEFGALGDDDSDGLTNIDELTLKTSPLLKDSDSDLISDRIELLLDWDPLQANTGSKAFFDDFDGDGLSNIEEQTLGTALDNADSDGDGISDYIEALTQSQVDEDEKVNWSPLIDNSGIYAKLSDFDGDGLTNGQEVALNTSLVDVDTDSDGINDYHEVVYSWDPLNAQVPESSDFDSDGI
ncbi:hypothetical protein H5300_26525, partial [Vibrio sp. SG41-7]|nr:hypothetical protein [Vibrio sp. SG41-7]